jgi:serine/threonine-protein kinase
MPDTRRIASEAVAHLGGTDRRVVERAMQTGLVVWPLFAILDAYMCFVAYPGAPFLLFVFYRVAIELVFLFVYRVSTRETLGAERLFRWLSLAYIAPAFTIALMAIPLGGIRSPYMHGISIVALVWAALVPTNWHRALTTFLFIGLAFPLVIGFGALLSPAARADWFTVDALTVFTSNYVFVLASATLSVILGHMVWSAQQEARTLGSYKLEELLGRGGMGEVWRATHQLLARQAAIKLIRPEALGGDADTRQIAMARFEREAQATASLRSPHTIEVYDFGVSDTGTFYCVMELLVGYDVQTLVERFGPLPVERVVYLLAQVCDSLSEAHAARLVHRDIKPSNIYVCRYGRQVDFVKVLDFGLVKRVRGFEDDQTQLQLTAPLAISGTPAFMAPEQVLGGADTDARTDLYAVGCVAFWLLTGRTVFQGSTVMQVLMKHVHDEPLPPSRFSELPLPAALDAVILRCLAKSPDDRPQSADELAEALTAACDPRTWTTARASEWWKLRSEKTEITPEQKRG